MIPGSEAPLTPPHALVPQGQLSPAEGHSVVPPGQGSTDEDLDPPDITRMRRMFDESRDLTDRARQHQQKDEDYYDGPRQLSPEVRAVLNMRRQPHTIDNRIAPAIDGILGVMEGAKTDPRAFPRNPEDQAAADVATKTLRYVADKAQYQVKKMDCAEDYLKKGLCAAIVEWGGKNPVMEQVRWETFFYDPRSRKADFSDAKYKGIAKWMYVDEVKMSWPRAKEMGDIAASAAEPSSVLGETFDDRPNDQMRWVDKRRNRVLVVEIYYLHRGEWIRCVFIAAGWLEYGRSPYLNVITGETRCPIEAQSFKIDRENNRYGPIRNMIPMQDEVNARRSRGLHLLNSRQIQIDPDMYMPVDADLAREEAARPDGVLPLGTSIVPTTDMQAGNLQMLAEAKDSLARMVPVALAQDLREGTAASGRARQVAQQAGLTQFGRGFGRFDDFELRIYKQFWMCTQQFMTDEQYVRISDNPRAPEFLKINEPVYGMVMQPAPVVGEDGQPVVDPETGQPAVQMQPAMGVVGVKNRPAEMDMDIIVGTSPDTVALEQEIFDSLMDLVKSGIDPFSPQFQLLIELAPLPDKTRLMERLEAFQKQQQDSQVLQLQQQIAQLTAQLQQKQEYDQADTAKTLAERDKIVAETEEIQTDSMATALSHVHTITQPVAKAQSKA